MLQDFKDFINRGNVVDLAVAVVIGAAFTPVINALVDRIIMPLVGMIVGEPNFDAIGTFACEEGEAAAAEGLINGCSGSVGAVITVAINFLLVAFAVFLLVRVYNRFQQRVTPEETTTDEAPAEPQEVVLLREIRDALAARPRP